MLSNLKQYGSMDFLTCQHVNVLNLLEFSHLQFCKLTEWYLDELFIIILLWLEVQWTCYIIAKAWREYMCTYIILRGAYIGFLGTGSAKGTCFGQQSQETGRISFGSWF